MLLTRGNWRRKKSFWNDLFHLVRCIPENEMVVLVGDMNGMLEVVMLAMMGRMVFCVWRQES